MCILYINYILPPSTVSSKSLWISTCDFRREVRESCHTFLRTGCLELQMHQGCLQGINISQCFAQRIGIILANEEVFARLSVEPAWSPKVVEELRNQLAIWGENKGHISHIFTTHRLRSLEMFSCWRKCVKKKLVEASSRQDASYRFIPHVSHWGMNILPTEVMPCPTWKNLEQLGWRISNCMFDRIPAIVFSREKAYLCSPGKLIPSNHQLWLWPQKVFLASILLMIQKSGDHQLRLVVYPIIYGVLYIPNGDRRMFSINRMSV